jgi:hypothetical protein
VAVFGGVAVEVADELADEPLVVPGRLDLVAPGGGELLERFEERREQRRGEQLLLAVELAVEHGQADARPRCDVAHRCLRVAVLGEEAGGRVEDQPAHLGGGAPRCSP